MNAMSGAMQLSRGLTFHQKVVCLPNSMALNGHNPIICRFARPRHLSRRREQRWRRPAFGTASGGGGAQLCSQAPAAAPCRRPQPSSKSPRARASRSSSRRASPRPAIRRVLGRAGPPSRRPPPRLST
eukprot:scaffold91329_cov54-Phaeocystis_antarctica.AAC.3